jgi:hypothetical protein
LDEARNLLEVVREIGVDHHDVVASSFGEAGEVRTAIAAPRLVYDPRPSQTRENAAAVIGTVVDDDYLSVEIVLVEDASSGVHALADALRLVQTRDHDRDLDRIALLCGKPLPKDADRHARYLRAGQLVAHPPTG